MVEAVAGNEYCTVELCGRLAQLVRAPPLQYASAIHSFLSSYDIKNKTIYLFACHGGGGADKYYAKMKKRLQGNIVAGTIDFIEPLKGNQKDIKKRIADFRKDNF